MRIAKAIDRQTLLQAGEIKRLTGQARITRRLRMDWRLAQRVVLALVDGLFLATALPSPRSVRVTAAALVRAPWPRQPSASNGKHPRAIASSGSIPVSPSDLPVGPTSQNSGAPTAKPPQGVGTSQEHHAVAPSADSRHTISSRRESGEMRTRARPTTGVLQENGLRRQARQRRHQPQRTPARP